MTTRHSMHGVVTTCKKCGSGFLSGSVCSDVKCECADERARIQDNKTHMHALQQVLSCLVLDRSRLQAAAHLRTYIRHGMSVRWWWEAVAIVCSVATCSSSSCSLWCVITKSHEMHTHTHTHTHISHIESSLPVFPHLELDTSLIPDSYFSQHTRKCHPLLLCRR